MEEHKVIQRQPVNKEASSAQESRTGTYIQRFEARLDRVIAVGELGFVVSFMLTGDPYLFAVSATGGLLTASRLFWSTVER